MVNGKSNEHSLAYSSRGKNSDHFFESEQGFLILDSDLKVMYWSENMEKITGYTKEEMLGEDLFVTKYPHLLSKKEVFEKSFFEKKEFLFDYFNPDRERWYRISIFPVGESLYTTLIDVTEDKERYNELLSVKNLNQYVLDSTSDVVWAIDRHYKLLLGNQSYLDIMRNNTGRDIKVGDSVLESGRQDDVRVISIQKWKESYDFVLNGKGMAANFLISTSTKKVVHEVNFQPVLGDDGREVIGVACFARDVTERTKHLESIEKQNTRLREISWLHSHQMRSPLSNILGLTNLLLTSEDPAEKEELVELLQKSAVQLDEIILNIANKINQE